MRQPSRKIGETSEHKVIADWLRVGLGPRAKGFHIRNERVGAYQRILAARMGVLSGVPDFCVLANGTSIWIEIKPRGWKASNAKLTAHEERQDEVRADIQATGNISCVAETLDEVIEILQGLNVPIREHRFYELAKRGIALGLAADPESELFPPSD